MANGNGNAEFRGQMKQWVEHFEQQRSEDVKTEEKHHTALMDKFDGYHKDIQEQFKNHKEYHKDNEHKWGTWTLFKKKPVVTLIVGGLFTSGLAYAGYNLKDIIKMLISFAK